MKSKTKRHKAPPGRRNNSRFIPWILKPGNYFLVRFQEALNRIFPASLNPMYYLGAITFLFFWILLGSGVYLYLFYEMDPVGAYNSVQYMTEGQKYYGGIARSLHRYASDGIMIVIMIHIIQVIFSDRFRQYRWVAWVSGAMILPAMWVEGISGYTLVWDQTAQNIALYLADIIDVLPINSEPLQRNFLTNDSVNQLMFFVLNYLHIAIPGLLLILAWIHCMRISMPLITPPRPITTVILASLLVLSVIKPAVSMAPADLSALVGQINVDWFYLPLFPFMSHMGMSGESVWLWGAPAYLLFIALPWVIPAPKKDAPQTVDAAAPNAISVNEELCKGCVLCQEACPFEAVIVTPGPNGSGGMARVIPARCSECGFCVNVCEFDAISMGQWDRPTFKEQIEKMFRATGAPKNQDKPTCVAFVCERSVDYEKIVEPGKSRLKLHDEVAVMLIPCIGVINPSIVKHALDAGAGGVVIVACRALDCHYREARRRIKLKNDRKMNDFLVENMDDPRVKVMHISPFEHEALAREIAEFSRTIKKHTAGKDVT